MKRVASARGAALGVLVVLVAAILLALLNPTQDNGGSLDPTNPGPAGSRAVVQVLRAQGVTVDALTDSRQVAENARGATVLVNGAEILVDSQLARLARAGASRIVLISPTQPTLDVLAPGVRGRGGVDDRTARPDCADPDAGAAGEAAAGGELYSLLRARDPQDPDDDAAPLAPASAVLCYPEPTEGGPTGVTPVREGSMVRTTGPGGVDVVVLGRWDLLANDTVDDDGNAALALRLLGGTDRLVWYTVDPLEPAPGERHETFNDLLPAWVPWVGAWLLVVLLAAMLWRGRRLGPLVGEPLPVVVRAAETQEGRARLYRQARARDRAAEGLRAASARRLARRLSAGPQTSGRELALLVAERSGRHVSDVERILLGDDPASDVELVRLADQLDRLERALARGSAGHERTNERTSG
ncbi:DUF4350 domain-containing protein [Spongisporangium articulatum]|uniref:DUF4350 domain-containing protein n=1 Tax=Spongisporangium articulatum TaxID=3362603 RepID=A0ABW8AJX6_9ACTN